MSLVYDFESLSSVVLTSLRLLSSVRTEPSKRRLEQVACQYARIMLGVYVAEDHSVKTNVLWMSAMLHNVAARIGVRPNLSVLCLCRVFCV